MSDILANWDEFPKIGLVVDGKKCFHSLNNAIFLWDSGMLSVADTGEVLNSDFTVRTMTKQENSAFQSRVDDYSARK